MHLDDKVIDMLSMPVNLEPDSDVGYKQMVKRLATVDEANLDKEYAGSGARIVIKVRIQDEMQYRWYDKTFEVFYPGGTGPREQGNKLIEFLNAPEEQEAESIKGKEVYINYVTKNQGGRHPVLHMIALVQTQTGLLYAKGDDRNDRLEPHLVKAHQLKELIEKRCIVLKDGIYRLNAPVLTPS